jgi:hypothetical protein
MSERMVVRDPLGLDFIPFFPFVWENVLDVSVEDASFTLTLAHLFLDAELFEGVEQLPTHESIEDQGYWAVRLRDGRQGFVFSIDFEFE